MNKVVVPNAILLGEVKSLLAEGKDVVIPTKGNSMLPFIRGDKDSVRLELRQDVNPGDIVLAMLRPGHYVLHRVAARDGDRLTLHGDGNLRGNEVCTAGDVVGTATSIIRPSGKERDCTTRSSKRAAALWNGLPVLVRRVYLAINRRLR